MPVIKRDGAKDLVKDAIVLDLADIVQQGEALRRAARQDAERIIAEAQAERERLIADADATGHAQGLARGLTEGQAKGEAQGRAAAEASTRDRLDALQANWATALEEFITHKDHLVVACKQDVLRLAISIAERIVHRTIQHDPGVIEDQIESALHLVAKPTRAVIAVAPGDLELAREVLPGVVSRLEGVEHAEIIEDDSLSAGACVLRAEAGGEVDASISTQLVRIAELLVPGISAGASGGTAGTTVKSETGEDEDEASSGSPGARGDLAA